MEQQGPRYGVYFVPAADSALYRFGSAVLQYDCYTGQTVRPLDAFAADADAWRRDSAEPRRYGFHATLKAPFYLLPSCTETQLISAVQSFAAFRRRRAVFEPVVRVLSGFVAIVADRPNPAVDALAADCTTIFDAFRAPVSAQERARRIAMGLNQSQIGNLDRWGYPYLFADFHFHMTLTGRIPVSRRANALKTLRGAFQHFHGNEAVAIDRLALVRQDDLDAAFHVLSVAPLRSES